MLRCRVYSRLFVPLLLPIPNSAVLHVSRCNTSSDQHVSQREYQMSESTQELTGHFPLLSLAILTLLVGVLLTAYLMRKNRKHEYGHIKGVAVDPQKILRDNPPNA